MICWWIWIFLSNLKNVHVWDFIPFGTLWRGQIKKVVKESQNKILLIFLIWPLEARAEFLEKISWVFWEIWRHQKDILKLTDLYRVYKMIQFQPKRIQFFPLLVFSMAFQCFIMEWATVQGTVYIRTVKLLTANIFKSGPMPTTWKFLDWPPLLPSCKLKTY